MSNQKFEKVLMHLRKSRADLEAEARGEGETLAKHEAYLFKFAKEHDINIVHIRRELESGEFLIHRPKMLKTLHEVEQGMYDGVLCMDIDRLGRGKKQDQGIILETFKNSGTKIITPRKVYDLSDEWDEEYVDFEQFMAHKELRYINRRLQRGRIGSIENGNYLSPQPPYGWLIKKEGKGNRYLIPHPEQGPVVQMIFKWYNEDDPNQWMGSSKIANELTRLNIPSYTGKPWDASSVLTILKNPVNAGFIAWKKKEIKKSLAPGKKKDTRTRPKEEQILVKGKHYPGQISLEEFQKTQERLKGKYHVPYQLVHGITNPLAGLVRCDMCGASMVLRPYSHQQYPHLICHNRQCTNKSSRFMYVESRIIEKLTQWLKECKLDWGKNKTDRKKTESIIFHENVLKKLNKEMNELTEQKSKLHDLLERGIYDTDTFLERSQVIAERLESTRLAIEETTQKIKTEKQNSNIQKEIIPKMENVLDLYSKTDDPAKKNALLKSVLNYSTYRKEKNQKDDDFTLILYPKLPQKLEFQEVK